MDCLEGLPRAVNRWCLLIGAELLRSSANDQATPGSTGLAAVGERPDYGQDPRNPSRLDPAAGDLVSPRVTRGVSGRYFVRVARGIHDLLVRVQTVSQVAGRDAQRTQPEIRLAAILVCRALKPSSDMGRPGAGGASFAEQQCFVWLFVLRWLGLAESCGPAGPWLFWLTETIRSCRIAAARSLQRQCAVPPTRHRGARHQHVRVDEDGLASGLDHLIGSLPLWRVPGRPSSDAWIYSNLRFLVQRFFFLRPQDLEELLTCFGFGMRTGLACNGVAVGALAICSRSMCRNWVLQRCSSVSLSRSGKGLGSWVRCFLEFFVHVDSQWGTQTACTPARPKDSGWEQSDFCKEASSPVPKDAPWSDAA